MVHPFIMPGDYQHDPLQRAVLITIDLSDDELGRDQDFDELWAMELCLRQVLAETNISICDGHEIGDRQGVILFMA